MRQFAAKYPERVAGLVLIDPVAPGEWFPLSDQERRRLTIGAKICRRLVADNGRHWVIVDDPKLVLESILEMVDFVCEFGPLEGGDPFDSRLSA
jgi:alpha-galactosidase/6-phospho-beta-glucosidase family protein